MAANLETLELTINGNAEGAKQGIDNLILSLSHLSDALVKPYADLRDFNAELKKLKDMGKITFTVKGTQQLDAVEKTTRDIKKGAKEISDIWQQENVSDLDAMIVKYNDLNKKLQEGISGGKWDDTKIANATLQLHRLEEQIETLQDSIGNNPLRVIDEDATKTAESFMKTNNAATYLKTQIESIKQKLGRGILEGTMDAEQQAKLGARLEKLQKQYSKIPYGIKLAAQAQQEAVPQMKSYVATTQEMTEALEDYHKEFNSGAPKATPEIDQEIYQFQQEHYSRKEITTERRNPPAVSDEEDRVEKIRQSLADLANKMVDTASKAENLTTKYYAMRQAFIENAASGKLTGQQLADGALRLQKLGAEVRKAVQAEKELKEQQDGAKQSTREVAQAMMESSSKIELMNSRLDAMKESYLESAENGKLNSQQLAEGALRIQKFEGEIQKAIKAEEELAHQSDDTKSALERLKEGAKNSTEGVSKLWNRIKRIAGNMLIRTGIRALVKDVREGINNLYEWSKLNKGEFGKSVDAMRAKALQLKNSIGAAIAPVIQAAIPVIQSLASAAIKAFNYINQLISLLAGKSTWTAAVENIENTTDAVNSGTSAAKDWLASFDELNVMNSDSGGGGGGANTTEYENMFQEMNTFDQKIRDLVGWIKDNMDLIKVAAIAIGTAILAWKVADAFSGVISTLAGFVATGAVIALTVTATWALTNQYLQTGDEGWLIAEMFTTAVGSTIAGLLANAFIGQGTGYAAAAVTLSLSAVVGISALVGNTDVSAISEEGLLTAVENALKVGVAAGLLMHLAGVSTMTAIGGGAVTTLAIFGTVIGIKTVLDASKSDKITAEDLKGIAITSLSMGLSAALIAKIAVPNLSLAATLGFAGSVTLATALLTAGAVIAIKATTIATENGEITGEVLKKDALASITMGGAIAVVAGMAGASIGTILALAGGVAVATFGALVGIQAILTTNKANIDWGDLHLTEKQIDEFVREEMFTVDPKLFLNITEKSISEVSVNSQKIGETLGELMGTLEVINLGLADSDDYAYIRKQVLDPGGLIDQVTAFINSADALNKLVLKFTPKLIGDTPEEQAQWYTDATNGWDTVQGYMQDLGKQLADEIVVGENNEIKVKRPERVANLLREITAISNILAGQDIATEAYINMRLSLQDLDESGFTQAMQKYSDYKKQMEEAAEEIQATAEANQIRLIQSLKEALSVDPENPKLQADLAAAETGLQTIIDNYDKSLNDAMDNMSAPGRNMLQEWLNKNFDLNSVSIPWTDEMLEQWLRDEDLSGTLTEIFQENGFDMATINISDLMEVGGFNLLSEDLQKKLIEYVKVTPETITTLKSQLGLSASQIIQFSDWNSFSSDQQVQFLKSLKDAYGSKDALEAAKAAGIDVGKAISEGLESNDSEIQRIAQEMSDEFSNQKPEMNVDANLPKSEVTEVSDAITNGAKPTVTADAVMPKGQVTEVSDAITNGAKPTVTADAVMPKDQVTEVSDAITNGAKPTVTADAVMPQEQVTEVAEAVTNGAKPTVTADAVMPEPEVTEMTNAIQNGSKPVVITDAVMPESEITEVTDAVQNGAKPQVNTSLLLNKNAIKDYKKKVKDKVKPEVPSKLQNVTDENMKEWKKNVEKNKADIATKLKLPTKAELNDQINGQGYDPTISVKTKVEEAILKRMKEQIESVNASVIADIKAKDSNSAVIDSFKKAMINAINRINVNLLTGGGMSLGNVHLEARRKGGLVNSGDMFIANEDGTPELIAKFGNQTAVANTEQMVDAMARGVQYANESQNALLAEQNSLLRAILNKENSVRLGASAALGRIARQSLDMYGAAMGV